MTPNSNALRANVACGLLVLVGAAGCGDASPTPYPGLGWAEEQEAVHVAADAYFAQREKWSLQPPRVEPNRTAADAGVDAGPTVFDATATEDGPAPQAAAEDAAEPSLLLAELPPIDDAQSDSPPDGPDSSTTDERSEAEGFDDEPELTPLPALLDAADVDAAADETTDSAAAGVAPGQERSILAQASEVAARPAASASITGVKPVYDAAPPVAAGQEVVNPFFKPDAGRTATAPAATNVSR